MLPKMSFALLLLAEKCLTPRTCKLSGTNSSEWTLSFLTKGCIDAIKNTDGRPHIIPAKGVLVRSLTASSRRNTCPQFLDARAKFRRGTCLPNPIIRVTAGKSLFMESSAHYRKSDEIVLCIPAHNHNLLSPAAWGIAQGGWGVGGTGSGKGDEYNF